MKTFTITQAAVYLMISRHTLGRMAEDGRLPADSLSGSGRKLWNKSTLDSYRLGSSRTGSVALVDCPMLPEMAVTVLPGQTLLGYRCVVSPLSSANRAEALAELAAFLVAKKPAALALPSKNHAAHAVQTVIDICGNSGIAVLLLP
ncbi:helix-turn-helix domain-containing protein [Pseudomonas sp. NPDC089569]|uniref:helix-turn-helix domain-containing protein n=1 Tax=Pseudomonas sp. NPDC089569 TaxID=3390722 RepID=UPI003CFF76CA